MSDLIMAADKFATNADLIEACARLGYLQRDWCVLDPTYHKGTWWKLWRPDDLVTLNREVDGSDFRKLPYPDGTLFDAAAYDPPYVCPGGLKSSNIKEMHSRYGMNEGGDEHEAHREFTTPAELQTIINAGLREMARVVKPRGIILCKCKDYVWSGKYWNGTYLTQKYAIEKLGLTQIDRFEHIGTPGPQSQKRQVHARRNLSTLFVFRNRRS